MNFINRTARLQVDLIVILFLINAPVFAEKNKTDLGEEALSSGYYGEVDEQVIGIVRVVTELVQPTDQNQFRSLMLKKPRSSRGTPEVFLRGQRFHGMEDDSRTYRRDYLDNVVLVDDNAPLDKELFEWSKHDLIRCGLPENLTLAIEAIYTWAKFDAVEVLHWLADTGTRDQRIELETLVLADLISQRAESAQDYSDLLVNPGELEYLYYRMMNQVDDN